MKKTTLYLIITFLLALLTLYTVYQHGLDFSFSLTISKNEISLNWSMAFVFTLLTIFSGAKYLTYKLTS
ncbi:hypothetical protein EFN63_06700 [Leuconostoc citreum]|uniref:hypothetical protein n=1 Tax=Leuconostoc citreum TaxID=33964 RepID=UPI0002465EFF|nr:hypothetical protein [Leuconostoc citreum]QOG10272.1 hypothetical protein FAZ25_05270 [Leuconostoc sp. LN180020]CCF29201.1 Putative uncharacterized protein [Leuconostoc citreum LBAE E16]MCS8583745.1 hypothetical protein [Leuconostoc citreum]MCS8601739.1 hypothetical protein [Leuconostoc citreum]MCT3068051.1 hypothetical protein [Leuconostoc citreum]